MTDSSPDDVPEVDLDFRADDDAERSDEEERRMIGADDEAPDPNLGIRAGDDAERSDEEERRLFDVATAPELDDDELGAVLEALLLVVDTPVTVEALAAATR